MSWAQQVDKYRKQIINEDSVCAHCGTTEHLTLDHVIPVSILLKMGYTKFETWELKQNLMVVCRDCNVEKKGNICLKHPQTHLALTEIMVKNPPTIGNMSKKFRKQVQKRDSHKDKELSEEEFTRVAHEQKQMIKEGEIRRHPEATWSDLVMICRGDGDVRERLTPAEVEDIIKSEIQNVE